MPAHRTRLPLPARARGDDEIVFAASDRVDQSRDQIAAIGAVAVHEDDDAAFRRRGGGTRRAGAAIAPAAHGDERARRRRRPPLGVPSLLPPSATMISRTRSRGISVTTAAIDLRLVQRRDDDGRRLEAPSQPAILARLRRRVADQRCAEILVGGAVPDLAQALLGRVAERVGLVAARRERRDAARQRAAMGGEIHQRPRPAARRPRRRVLAALQAEPRARSRQRHR